MSFLNLEAISFKYPTGPEILSINSLSLEKGQSLFIYGPSGFGKSTLLNLIAGVLVPSSGKIIIDGVEISKLSASARDSWRGAHMGYVFQNFNLIPYLSILENITLPSRFSKVRREKTDANKEAIDLMERMGLSQFRNRAVSELSIGQQQRVALCRALIGKPKILLADEPTSSLDEKNTGERMNLLKEERAKSELTTIFVSHDLRLKPFFDLQLSLPEINRAQSLTQGTSQGLSNV